MRDPWGLNEWAFARWYPVVTRWSENAGQRETRARLVAQASGRTLEIGAGSGLNLPHYPASVTELVVTEPSPHMLDQLRATLESAPPPVGSWELIQTGAESLPFEDSSFDTVVATFVHCTIPDPLTAMNEIVRVLRPEGGICSSNTSALPRARCWPASRTPWRSRIATSAPAATRTVAPRNCSAARG